VYGLHPIPIKRGLGVVHRVPEVLLSVAQHYFDLTARWYLHTSHVVRDAGLFSAFWEFCLLEYAISMLRRQHVEIYTIHNDFEKIYELFFATKV